MLNRPVDLVAIQQMRSRMHNAKTSMRILPVASLLCILPTVVQGQYGNFADDDGYQGLFDDDFETCKCFSNGMGLVAFTFIIGLLMAGVFYLLVLMLWVVPKLQNLYKNEGEEVQGMVLNKKTWTTQSHSTDKDGRTSTSTQTHYRMTVKYVVANGDTVTKELTVTPKQYSDHFEGNNVAMIYLKPPHDPRTAILKDQLTVNFCPMICGLVVLFALCAGASFVAFGDLLVGLCSMVHPCVFIWTIPLAILLGGWGALRTEKAAVAPTGQIQTAGSTPAPVVIKAEVVAVTKSTERLNTERPKGAKFDPNTGAPIPKFDPETGKQNW